MGVPDSRAIRTLASGRVTFTGGNETVDIAPNTQIQIFAKGGRKPFTTVKQYFGTVSVKAEVQQVQHFAVQTSYLAAVVKGTRFTSRPARPTPAFRCSAAMLKSMTTPTRLCDHRRRPVG